MYVYQVLFTRHRNQFALTSIKINDGAWCETFETTKSPPNKTYKALTTHLLRQPPPKLGKCDMSYYVPPTGTGTLTPEPSRHSPLAIRKFVDVNQ
jgi:hypothetical protein